MPNPLTITLGRLVQAFAKLRGSGTALPGLVVEKLEPNFAVRVLEQLPEGVVLVSGTNGKTTTVKIASELLEAAGLMVFTNNSGSNFMRGVISALLPEISLSGHLKADIAVLELDEAHAVAFVNAIKPRYSLLLNVMLDQLERFGSLETTAQLLATVARNTTDIVVLNSADPLLARIPADEQLQAKPLWFGEDGSCFLTSFEADTAKIELDGQAYSVPLALKGRFNAVNATAALALVHAIVPQTPPDVLTQALAKVQPAFGRGESFTVAGISVELVLVKNPDGFAEALASFAANGCATMIATSDEYGDGRDISWYYCVDFSSLQDSGVTMLCGSRALDMMLRLRYDEVLAEIVVMDVGAALDDFLTDYPGLPHRIYCSYTTMLELRKLLSAKSKKGAGAAASGHPPLDYPVEPAAGDRRRKLLSLVGTTPPGNPPQSFTILRLFGSQLDIYGDAGNLQVLQKRALWRGISVELLDFAPGDDLAICEHADLILAGGGLESSLAALQPEFIRLKACLKQLIDAGVPALVVGASYQLFGESVCLADGELLEGLAVFTHHTELGSQRETGNITTLTSDFGELIGYENHAGLTFLDARQLPLAIVAKGFGNNGADRTEGARYKNAIGTYLGGPVLSKNPKLADFLIKAALEHRYDKPIELAPLKDKELELVRVLAKTRDR